MRATLHISLLAATLSPSLVQSSPIPFTQNYNSSPRSSAQALADTSRPGGVFSSRNLLTHGGSRSYGLGFLDLGSNNGGNGGDASSGNSYAQGGDHHGDEDNHPAGGGGPPTIDLGPMGDQPPPEPTGDANPKPGGQDPGESAPPHHESKDGVDPNVGDGGSKSVDESTPGKTTNADNPAPPPPKPGLDPGAGKSTPEIPVFLGPTNSNPPPGSSGPPSDAPQDLGYPGDEGRNGYTEDTSCDDLFGESLINLMSNNGGDGGDAFGDGGSGSNSAYSGAGGDASGGSVNAYPALINILSNNGGDGGNAKSGDSFSKRHGSASYSGSGGKASGGSVKKPCSKRRSVSQPTDSGTSGNGFTSSRSGGSLLAVQRKWDGRSEAYSGKGGDASGGSVKGEHGLINIGSGNGGHGGDASSGFAYANGSGAKAYSGAGGKATGGDIDRRALNVRASKASYLRFSPQGKYGREHHDSDGLVNVWSGNGGDGGNAQSGNAFASGYGASAHSGPGGDASGGSVTDDRYEKVGRRDGGNGRDSGAEAYTGAGGKASGGSVEGKGGLINLFSGNGGDGGDASSGDAFAYSEGAKAKAYSGPGGDASGGSVKDEKSGYGHGYRSGGPVDVTSGNGGDGGDASSGNAVAVSHG
ncbi:hypothetical protein DFH94DRAFT_828471 [Russula ochroleuca]|uniref:Uncharacterized protein n=1 Tax=Russula ochroleuca TaxID=152965 RepID=A0A9P5MX33_9AGAM|nr:hypothetical protein DFH94DRAFT_828471 [Russula ochroleuca]